MKSPKVSCNFASRREEIREIGSQLDYVIGLRATEVGMTQSPAVDQTYHEIYYSKIFISGDAVEVTTPSILTDKRLKYSLLGIIS